ncbi:hypothetical protein BDV18DRAFT_13953 [Aspergillus unguis]
MPPTHQYSTSSSSFPRHSMLPSSTNPAMAMSMQNPGPTSMSTTKQRQYAQLESKLAQLNANLADTKNLVGVTAVQARDMRFLGGYVGALFMGAASVLGDEGVKKNAEPVPGMGRREGNGNEDGDEDVEMSG